MVAGRRWQYRVAIRSGRKGLLGREGQKRVASRMARGVGKRNWTKLVSSNGWQEGLAIIGIHITI